MWKFDKQSYNQRHTTHRHFGLMVAHQRASHHCRMDFCRLQQLVLVGFLVVVCCHCSALLLPLMFALIGWDISRMREHKMTAWAQRYCWVILIWMILFKSWCGVLATHLTKNYHRLSVCYLIIQYSHAILPIRLLKCDEAILQSCSAQLNPNRHCQLVVCLASKTQPNQTKPNQIPNIVFGPKEPNNIVRSANINHK